MCSITDPRLIWLLEKMAGYRIKIEHIRGSTNTCVDDLSRQPRSSWKTEDVPRFGKISYTLKRAVADGGKEVKLFREDMKKLANIGLMFREYKAIIDIVKGTKISRVWSRTNPLGCMLVSSRTCQ